MSTFFRDATLVQFDPPLVLRGNLRQDGGRIVAVGDDITPSSEDEIVECQGAVLCPGLVNGHTHLYSALAVGMPAPPQAPANFHDILRFVWWRLDRAHTLESVRASGVAGALAAVRCGTTTLVDHHASPNAIENSLSVLEEGIAAIGLRGVLCYETTCRNRPDEAREGLGENERYAQLCQQRRDGRFAALVGAHASFTLDEDALAGCVDVARRCGVGVHIHAAEDPVDERLTLAEYGCKLLDRFERHGLLELPGTIIAHGTHFSDADVARINEHADTVTMAHNPRSNMNNGVGYARPRRYNKPPMLGTDGIGGDLWNEARTALFKSNDAGAELPFTRPLEMLGESARYASQVLGTRLGVLEVGATADLVLTDYHPATPLSADNLAGHLIFAMGPEFVQSVMIDGRWVLRDGQILACDEPTQRAKLMDISRELHTRMAAIACE